MDITFINYNNRYSNNFYELNIEWLEKYFSIENYDRSVLSNPEKYIINRVGLFYLLNLTRRLLEQPL